MRIIISESQHDDLQYKKWKRDNVTYRGISNMGDDGEPVDNNGMAKYGVGLYSVPASNKSMARGYGKLYYVVNGKPTRPKIFRNTNEAEIFIQRLSKDYGYDAREFDKHTTIPIEMGKIGYNGLIITGREMVNYKPENLQFFRTEDDLYNYYYYNVQNPR
jgi:hypothetical protein